MHKGIYGIATSKNYQTKEVSGIHNLMHDVNTGEGGSEGDENNFGSFVRGHIRMPMSLLVPLIGVLVFWRAPLPLGRPDWDI